MENHIKMDDLGVPLFSETPKYAPGKQHGSPEGTPLGKGDFHLPQTTNTYFWVPAVSLPKGNASWFPSTSV